MSSPASIRINDDFTSRQSGVTHRASDDERAARVDVVHSVVVQQISGNNRFNHLTFYVSVFGQFMISLTFSASSALSLSISISGPCCVETTIVWTRCGTQAPPSKAYSIVTCRELPLT